LSLQSLTIDIVVCIIKKYACLVGALEQVISISFVFHATFHFFEYLPTKQE